MLKSGSTRGSFSGGTSNPPSGPNSSRTVQEQLRADHIEALSKIHQLRKENEELQKQVQLSKSSEQPNQSPANTELLQELKKFRDSNLSLSSENSRLKEQMRKAAAEEKQKFQDQLSKSSEEFTLQMRRLQEQNNSLEVQNISLREQLEGQNQSSDESVTALQKNLQNLQLLLDNSTATVTERDHSIAFLQSESNSLRDQVMGIQQSHIDSQLQINDLHQQLQEYEQLKIAYAENYSKGILLEKENEQIRFELKESQEMNAQLQLELLNLHRQINRHKKIDQYGDSDSEEDKGSGANENFHQTLNPTKLISLASLKKESISIQTELSAVHQSLVAEPEQQQQQPDAEEEMLPQTFRFQEYLRLKRENRELKLRLADRDYVQQQQHQQQQHHHQQFQQHQLPLQTTRSSNNGSVRSHNGKGAFRGTDPMMRSSGSAQLPKLFS